MTEAGLLDAASRAATDELLAGLRNGRWRPTAWARFARSAARRSVHQARTHPRALVEVTAVHAVVAVRGRRGWVAVSWLLAASHLGMLEGRRSLGVSNVITLVRANLPALGGPPAFLPVLALVTDVLDGRLARRLDEATAFGSYADSLADAVFWTWFAVRHEPSRAMRVAALAAWAAPVVLVTVASMTGGRMVEPPRPALLRPAAAMQAVLATRALLWMVRLRRRGRVGDHPAHESE